MVKNINVYHVPMQRSVVHFIIRPTLCVIETHCHMLAAEKGENIRADRIAA